MALVLPAATAACSSTPLETFIYIFAVAMTVVVVTLAVLVAVDRRMRRRSEG